MKSVISKASVPSANLVNLPHTKCKTRKKYFVLITKLAFRETFALWNLCTLQLSLSRAKMMWNFRSQKRDMTWN